MRALLSTSFGLVMGGFTQTALERNGYDHPFFLGMFVGVACFTIGMRVKE